MKEYLQKLVREKGIRYSLILMIIIICLNAALVIYYRQVVIRSSERSVTVKELQKGLKNFDSNFRQADVGVRAYLIRQNSQFLYPYNGAKDNYAENLDNLEALLENSGFDVSQMPTARAAVVEYMHTLQLMIDLCDQGNVDEAIDIFLEDRGLDAWRKFNPFIVSCRSFVEELTQRSEADFRTSMNFILFVQILLILISVPILTLAFRKLSKDEKVRNGLFKYLIDSNKKYLYDDGSEIEIKDEDTVISNLINNLKKAAGFINSIAKGDYNINWSGLEGKAQDLNKESIAGELILMRNKMLDAKQQDDIRIWTNEGLSKFADLIRRHQDDLGMLSDKLVANIVEYIGAQQGGLFLKQTKGQSDTYLQLGGCYAYQRKKYMEKRVELGQGLVGQCFLEGESTYISNIPEEYVNITSGLGGTNPTTLLIVPLKNNEEIVGVLEIASLKPLEKHKISFVERLAETVASSIITAQTNENTKVLLEQSQQQAEEMRAQEEEMRQNMEELQATQEQMHRKNAEVEDLLKKSSENEESMKLQMEALQEMEGEASKIMANMKKEAEGYRSMLTDVLNELPQKVFIKDATGKIYVANNKVAESLDKTIDEVLGKTDYDFVDKKTADTWRKQEVDVMKNGPKASVFEEEAAGTVRVVESIKKAFFIKPLNQNGLLGIQTELSDKEEIKKKLKS